MMPIVELIWVGTGTGYDELIISHSANDSEWMAHERFEQERQFCAWDAHHTEYENNLRRRAFWEFCQATGEQP